MLHFFFPSEMGKFSDSYQGKKRNIQNYFLCVSLNERQSRLGEHSYG